jgi:Fe-S cluster assembly iron-binding protein IscA
MLDVTEKASEMIKSSLNNRTEPHSIRILMQAG